ncbi:hypothetical protein Tco_1021279 [Tanacetum coccineum]
MAPTTRRGPNTPVNNTNPNNITLESIQAMIDQALLRNSTNGDGSHSSHEDNRRHVQTALPCYYTDFMKFGRDLKYILNELQACSFMLCDLDFEPLTLSLTSMPSCDL